jgi:hypothetical protein
MDTQAERIYKSITDLLDLKQKHANAFEARFARDQAAGTARQSQTIMVFTIVTIIFLPLSFIAAIFTINIKEFPHDGGNITLPFSYVSKFIFGIGLAISIPLVFVALSVDAIGDFFREFKRRFSERSNRLPEERRQSAIGNGNGSLEKLNEMRAMEIALSVGRSTRAGGRRSIESYLGGGSLLPVMSRGTVRTGAHGSVKNQVIANGGINGGINGNGNGTVSVERPAMVERMSTGFRIRRSADVERGI